MMSYDAWYKKWYKNIISDEMKQGSEYNKTQTRIAAIRIYK